MDIIFTPLKIIEGTGGKVLHGIKASSQGFIGFGEAYFSTISFGETKNWRKHLRMTCNLIVPIGCVKFSIVDEPASLSAGELITQKFELSPVNYGRLTIPPGYWFNMQGTDPKINLVLNIADQEHDASELLTLPASIQNLQNFQF